MNKKIIFIIFAALILRLLLVFSAYHGDLNNNISWGDLLVSRGPVNFYEGGNWPYSAPNQPPLYVLLYGATSLIWNGIESASWLLNNHLPVFPSAFIWFWEEKGMTLVAKLPSIIADLGIGILIYKYFKKSGKDKIGTILATIWLFNPATWYNSTVWGQTDPIVNLLGLFAILLILERKLVTGLIILALSVLFKGSLTIFIPVIVILALYQKHKFLVWIKSILLSLLTVLIVAIAFHPQLDFPVWFINLYTNRIFPGEIGYLTANAFNFWWLVDSGKTLDSVTLLNIPFRIWGFGVFTFGYAIILLRLFKNKFDKRSVILGLSVIALLSFLFMTRMHERYLYPFLPLATIVLGSIPSLVAVYILYSISYVINLYHLFWVPSIPWLEMNFDKTNIGVVLSFLNIILFTYTFFIFVRKKVSS